MSAPTVTKAAIQRAIEATKAAGLTPTGVWVYKDGTVRVETAQKESVDTPPAEGEVLKPKQWATR